MQSHVEQGWHESRNIGRIAEINRHLASDWDTLRCVSPTTVQWVPDIAKLYESTIQGCPHTMLAMEGVNRSDHQSSFAVWLEKLVSGSPGEAFWSETHLTGLYHASANVQNRHVIALASTIRAEFLTRALSHLGTEEGMTAYQAFERCFDASISVMVDLVCLFVNHLLVPGYCPANRVHFCYVHEHSNYYLDVRGGI